MTDYAFNWDKPVKADTIANFCIYAEQNPEHVMRALFGHVQRSKFRWKDANEIYIGPGRYHHYGSTRNRVVWWNSELTFEVGSGGSNAGSDDVDDSAITWHYIYIDDSAVNTLASNELTAAEFLNSTTAPTWSDAYQGWYNGNDRCIFAILANASNAILEFFHDGGDLVLYADEIADNTATNTTSTFADANACTVPGFCQKALTTFVCQYVDASTTLYVRPNGSAGATGIRVGYVASTTTVNVNTLELLLDTSQKFEWKDSGTSTNTYAEYTQGYYLPRGM